MIEILNELSELVYISDLETYELLFLNDVGKRFFGIEKISQYRGRKCYEILQHKDAPCPFCTNSILSADRVYEWEFFNQVTSRHYLLKDKLIKWRDGRFVRMEVALDVSDLKAREQEMERVVKQEHFVNDCLRYLHRSYPIGKNILDILATIGAFFKADRTYIFDFDFEKQVTSNIYEWCADGISPQIDNLQNIPISVIARWVDSFKRHENVYIPDMEAVREISMDEYDVLHKQGIRSLIVIPLISESDNLLGYIGVDNPVYDISSIEFIFKTLSFFLVSIMTKSKLEKQLKDMSFTDMLTGLQNRNKFIRDLDYVQEVSSHNVGIAYVDMNGLKTLNDSFGHEKGNEALQFIAKTLLSVFRRSNLYRVGGDEFVVLCPDIPEDVFERKIREFCDSKLWDSSVSVSVGHLWFDSVTDIKASVRETDFLMYEQKKRHYAEKQEQEVKAGSAVKADSPGIQGGGSLSWLR